MVWTEQTVFCDADNCTKSVTFLECTPERGRYRATQRGWLCAADGTDLCPGHYQARYAPATEPMPAPSGGALCPA